MSEALTQPVSSALGSRMRELLEQSRRYQAELARIGSELERIQARIAALTPQGNEQAA